MCLRKMMLILRRWPIDHFSFRTTATTQLSITHTTRWAIFIVSSFASNISFQKLSITPSFSFSGCLFTSYSCPCFSTCPDASGSWWRGASWSSLAKERPRGYHKHDLHYHHHLHHLYCHPHLRHLHCHHYLHHLPHQVIWQRNDHEVVINAIFNVTTTIFTIFITIFTVVNFFTILIAIFFILTIFTITLIVTAIKMGS